ncbi:hypothetical protein KDJ56_05190 [Brevibacillus composti]|uniref:Uncharacterized protein n=1 Tax=Brevibacillus composti TaxID=2796470 RepID=A0A7T5JPN9_9BACL|nr:hypothetical protein [Brevibacillus composti]QQE75377.1 hypothetical protein JD108_05510 [Brevibacillus composti]QUO42403.1 hypothetical protein KDJ56_05190 [Brevibacillus composti]
MVSFQKLDGSYELWIQMNGETLAKRENVQAFRMEETRTALLIQQAGGWDAYDADLKPLTDGSYGSIEALSTYSGEKIMTYRDRKTGLLGVLSQDWHPATPPVYDSIKPFDQVFRQLAFERKPAPFVFTKKEKFGYLSQTGAELFQTALLTKRPTVTYQPLTAQPFPAYRELLRMDPLRLVDFGKPYGWASGQGSEANFFANLALYLQLPPAAGKQEVLAELTERGVLKADPLRTELTPPDWFALMHFVVTGSSGQALTAQQLEEWAMKRDLVRQYGHPINVDIYADYHQLFFRELLRAQAGSGLYKAKPLSLATLDEYQRNMLGALIKVNGRELMSLPVPLPAAELDRHLQVLIQQYNKQAAALLQAAVKQL